MTRPLEPFAVCVTTLGNSHVLEESLRSAWAVFPHDGPGSFVVVSADLPFTRAHRILRRLAGELGPGFRLEFRANCKRGWGRQRAFELACEAGARHAIQSVDTDTVYHEPVKAMLQVYRRHYAAKPVFMQAYCWSVASVATMRLLGGWPVDLQSMEDRAVWSQASRLGRLVFLPADATEHIRSRRRLTLPYRAARILSYNRKAPRVDPRYPGASTLDTRNPDFAPGPAEATDAQAAIEAVAKYWEGRARRYRV